MNLSEKEKEEFAKGSLSIVKTNFTKEEKAVFYKYLQVHNISDLEYFKNNISLFYEKNNIVELDILKFNSTIDTVREYTNDELKVLNDFFLITPCIVSIYAELIRQRSTIEDVLILYRSYINNFNKLLDRYFISPTSNDEQEFKNIIDGWITTFKNRIQDIQEQIELNKTTNVITTIKLEPVLEWIGDDTKLSKLSCTLKKFGYTNKPTDFEKVFKKQKPTIWIKEHYVLAYLLYRLGGYEIVNKKFKTIPIQVGYMNVASLYFKNCDSNLLSQQKNYLNDLSYKVRKSKKKYTETIVFVDSLLKDLNS